MRLPSRLSQPTGRVTFTLIASYAFDWIVVIAAAGIGALLSNITPNKRPFSLINPEISFPFTHSEKIPTWLLVVLSLAVPAFVIFIVSLVLVPGPTVSRSIPKALIWRRKLWEWHTGWLGLALSCAAAFLITGGMKNLFGKPRPDLLSRCQPNRTNATDYIVGGNVLNEMIPGFFIVSASICTSTDKSTLDDGFRSFPSGHSSFSAAGLIYLSLFLASKLAITIPYLSPSSFSRDESRFSAFPSRSRSDNGSYKLQVLNSSSKRPTSELLDSNSSPISGTGHNDDVIAARNQSAAPPIYLLVLAVIPFFAAIYISSTRFSDFRHHGFDILFGFLIGTITAILSFRFYHLPIAQGAGWAWGPRSPDRAFWAGVGVGNYVGMNARETTEEEADLEGRGGHLHEVGGGPAATQTDRAQLLSSDGQRMASIDSGDTSGRMPEATRIRDTES